MRGLPIYSMPLPAAKRPASFQRPLSSVSIYYGPVTGFVQYAPAQFLVACSHVAENSRGLKTGENIPLASVPEGALP
jgi:hypothetical protein